jgi:cell division protein FtsB
VSVRSTDEKGSDPAGGPIRPGQGRPAPAPGAGPRPAQAERSRLTSRAAVLAVVLCAIALSLAYPVREYIAQRRQIDQLQAQSQATTTELGRLRAEAQRLNEPAYIEQQAQDRLHMCLPGASCYVIIGGQPSGVSSAVAAAASTPWYERLWHSVRQADQGSPGEGSGGQSGAGQGASHAR